MEGEGRGKTQGIEIYRVSVCDRHLTEEEEEKGSVLLWCRLDVRMIV